MHVRHLIISVGCMYRQFRLNLVERLTFVMRIYIQIELVTKVGRRHK